MKSKLKKIAFVIAIACAFLLGSCSQLGVSAEQSNPVKLWPENTNGGYSTWIIVDEETGVNYIAMTYYVHSTQYGVGGITPRLNGDGTLFTS